MMLSDSVLSDANKSIELNALALKYLKDDQLTELAQLTVHKRITHQKTGENSLLRRVSSLFIAYIQLQRNCGLKLSWHRQLIMGDEHRKIV